MEHDDDFYMFHFKTVWCPFNTESREHYREKCVYAHNWQDFRRKPHVFEYDPRKPCEFWNRNQEIKLYWKGCEMEYRCCYSHGWKE